MLVDHPRDEFTFGEIVFACAHAAGSGPDDPWEARVVAAITATRVQWYKRPIDQRRCYSGNDARKIVAHLEFDPAILANAPFTAETSPLFAAKTLARQSADKAAASQSPQSDVPDAADVTKLADTVEFNYPGPQ